MSSDLQDRRDAAGIVDAALVSLVQNGYEGAFDLLVLRYHSIIKTDLMMRLPQEGALVVESLQCTFLKAFNHIKAFTGVTPEGCTVRFHTWLYTIMKNVAADYHRQAYRSKASALTIKQGIVPDQGALDEARADLLEALAAKKLTRKARSTYVLSTLCGLTLRETARVLQITVALVTSRRQAARRRITQ